MLFMKYKINTKIMFVAAPNNTIGFLPKLSLNLSIIPHSANPIRVKYLHFICYLILTKKKKRSE